MRYLASVSYDGSKFYGFQRLKNKKTVQGELEKVLTTINKTMVLVKGAGRTDRGVHALDQKIHFDLNIKIDIPHLLLAINSRLDPAVRVNYIEEVSSDFHARFDCIQKKYQYIINMGEYDLFIDDYVYNYNKKLNIKNMKKASKYLLGAHSFKVFTSGERENYNSIISKVDFKRRGSMLYITFTGVSFYRYMVRNLVGALLLAGEGRMPTTGIEEMLSNSKNIYNYMTVPANGLYLMEILYDKF